VIWIKASKIVIWLLFFLALFLSFFVYAQLYGTPWGKKQQEHNMQSYLSSKYHHHFIIKDSSYNYLSETYQSYAYPKDNTDLLFLVQQDPDSQKGYSDMYPKVYWESNLAHNLKASIKKLFPKLDESSFKAMQLVERGDSVTPVAPSYKEIQASQLACSISINLHSKWATLNHTLEIKKINKLNDYLQSIHFPVLIEVRYLDKVFFITEDGRIIDS
jgi:hypothetical protein